MFVTMFGLGLLAGIVTGCVINHVTKSMDKAEDLMIPDPPSDQVPQFSCGTRPVTIVDCNGKITFLEPGHAVTFDGSGVRRETYVPLKPSNSTPSGGCGSTKCCHGSHDDGFAGDVARDGSLDYGNDSHSHLPESVHEIPVYSPPEIPSVECSSPSTYSYSRGSSGYSLSGGSDFSDT